MRRPFFSTLRGAAKSCFVAALLMLAFSPASRAAKADGSSQVLAFSGDGTSVVTQIHQNPSANGYNTQFEVWQVATGHSVFRSAPLRNQTAWEAAFSPDGRFLVVGMSAPQPNDLAKSPANRRGEWILWDVRQKRVIRQSVVPYGWVTSVAFSPDGTQFAIASKHRDASDNSSGAKIWMVEAASAKTLRAYQTGWSTITSLDFSPDGLTLGACGAIRPPKNALTTNQIWKGTAQLWDAHSPAARQRLEIPDCDLIGLAFPNQGEILACRTIMRNLALQNALMAEIRRDAGENIALPDAATLQAAQFEKLNDVLAWNPRTGQTTRWPGSIETPELSLLFNQTQLKFGPDASTLMGVMFQNTPDPKYPPNSGYVETQWAVRTWQLGALSLGSAFALPPATTAILEDSRRISGDPILSPDGLQLAATDIQNNIQFWDSRTARKVGKSWQIGF